MVLLLNLRITHLSARITDGFRSIEEQNNLYAKGREQENLNKIGLNHVIARPNLNKVTNAIGGKSYHNFGIAIDVAFLKFNNKVEWNVEEYNKLAPLGNRLGFEWGGNWSSIIDRPHFQITNGLSTSQLMQRLRTDSITDSNTNITYPNLANE